ncbi:hypothetical protein RchiOBHm_Chr1g0349821 [Rosa chinensis]|uniref:Uncharacterized protein n=1 Tax=Rosa chinensis TaxID=74649 RepID=A0A2P6SFW6_ROSCH|nr:hypothetical protein RchiOBHm_Chr1g0349821 [Rosa chinensis]
MHKIFSSAHTCCQIPCLFLVRSCPSPSAVSLSRIYVFFFFFSGNLSICVKSLLSCYFFFLGLYSLFWICD